MLIDILHKFKLNESVGVRNSLLYELCLLHQLEQQGTPDCLIV